MVRRDPFLVAELRRLVGVRAIGEMPGRTAGELAGRDIGEAGLRFMWLGDGERDRLLRIGALDSVGRFAEGRLTPLGRLNADREAAPGSFLAVTWGDG